jgi:hypothetical protein
MTHQPRRMSYESEEMYSARIRQDRRERRTRIIFGWVTGAIIVAFIWLMVHVYNVASATHARFMNQCMQDHKEYEWALVQGGGWVA